MSEANEKLMQALATIEGAPKSGYYQHTSGGLYWFTAPALHVETLEVLAVYQSLAGPHAGVNWIRSLTRFNPAHGFERMTSDDYRKARAKAGHEYYGE